MNVIIGLAEAEARLSEVIDRVEAGESVIISRNGTPVAELRPIRRPSTEDTIEKIRAIAKRVSKRNAAKAPWPQDGLGIRDVAHERHRF